MRNEKMKKMILTGLMAALSFVAFAYLKINIPIGDSSTALHLGNAFCVLAALILGGGYGGLAGAIGLSFADLISPAYLTSAPKTFLMKLAIGLVVGLVAHRIGRITEPEKSKKTVFRWTLLSCLAGFGFNVVVDPVVGYFYKRFILGIDADSAKILATMGATATLVNAVISTVLVCTVYTLLRPALARMDMLFVIPPKKK